MNRLILIVATIWLSACGISPDMDVAAPAAIDLTGTWQLDRHLSDDVRARLLPAIEKVERRRRTIERPFEDDPQLGEPNSGPPNSPGETSAPARREGVGEPTTMQWMRQMRLHEAEALIAFIAPATQLDIRQSMRQGRLEMSVRTNKGEGTRVLVPGETSALFVSMGGFDVSSGWQKSTFVVYMRGTGDNDMNLVQYYTLAESGTQLQMRLEARIPELGKKEFKFVYLRSP